MKKKSPASHIPIKHYPEELRPREKLLVLGSATLSEQELLAILLRTGTREKSALGLAQDILAHNGLLGLTKMSIEEFSQFKGMGLAKAAQLTAAVELGKRLSRQSLGLRPAIRKPEDIASLLMGEMAYLDREHFKVINLNTKNQVMVIDTVSIGSLNASLVHPREVFKLPIKRSAASLILAHNHPSGDVKPSQEDIKITRRLCEAGMLLGVEIIDHIIIGQNQYCSMKSEGYI